MHHWATAFVASAVGLLTLYSMIKIWNEAFWKNLPSAETRPMQPVPWTMVVPAVGLAGCTVLFGIFPGIFFDFAERSAEQLMHPSIYIQAVLGRQAGLPEVP